MNILPEVEVWKPIPESPNYAVSNLGRVRRIFPAEGPIRKLKLGKNRYISVDLYSLSERSKPRWKLVHRLVLETFVGPCPKGMEAMHLNSDRTDNRLANLRWGTRSENHNQRVREGSGPVKENHHLAKLTEEKVREIRSRPEPSTVLAPIYGVESATIRAIRRRKIWKYVL